MKVCVPLIDIYIPRRRVVARDKTIDGNFDGKAGELTTMPTDDYGHKVVKLNLVGTVTDR